MSKRVHVYLLVILIATSCRTKTESYLYVDDFESYEVTNFPGGPWNSEGNGEIIVDDTRAVSGTKAVRFVTGEGYSERGFISLSGNPFFPLEDNELYGSVNFWVNSASPDGIHWTMIETRGKVPDQDFSSMIRYGGQHAGRFMANYDTDGIRTDCWQHSQTKLPEREWFNIKFYINGNEDLMKFWLNDQLIEDLTVKSKGQGCVGDDNNELWSFPSISQILIGWVDYQSGGGERELWIDDVVLSSKPIE